ncbi:MAG: hypothetical protein IPM99_17655 [Rubrivivax sp.]|nr:hypothetical protein [Rubrivivax sp.]
MHAVLMDDARVRLGVVWRNPGLVPGGNWLNPTGTIRGWVDAYRPLVALSGSFALLSRGAGSPAPVVAGGLPEPRIRARVAGCRALRSFPGPDPRRLHLLRGPWRRAPLALRRCRAPLEARGGGHVTMGLDGPVPMILTSAEGRRVYGPPTLGTARCRTGTPSAWWWWRTTRHRPADRAGAGLASPAYDLDTLRDLTLALGCHHAVALDGSDSAMLSCGGHWLLVNDDWKNRLNPNALVFFAA